MVEAFWVLVAVAVLGGMSMLALVLTSEAFLVGGLVAVGIGLAVGVPAGLWYHVILRRQLLTKGPLPERWWVSPVQYHERLRIEERRTFLPWFYVGGAGFVLIVVGAASVAYSLVREHAF